MEINKSSSFFKQLVTNPDLVEHDVISELIAQYPYISAFWFIKARNSIIRKDQTAKFDFQQAALISPQSALLYLFVDADNPSTQKLTNEELSSQKTELTATELTKETDPKAPSLYHDHTMPYSFIWWLNKTRLDHADDYQPYVQNKSALKSSSYLDEKDPLDQQMREHIFHIQDPELKLSGGNEGKTIPFKVQKKENPIIDKFISEDPQIKAPSPEKVSLENKARKSAVDESGFVSETLAKIYTEQGLFHKAIDTYKKLSLKFPEKSLYFADLIKQLEKQNLKS